MDHLEINKAVFKKALKQLDKKGIHEIHWDVETSLGKYYGFRPGEQVVRHTQMLKGYLVTPIICLSFVVDNHAPLTLLYDVKTGSGQDMISKFDNLIKLAQKVIGKNSNKFDNKHLNYHRMLNDMDGIPEWLLKTDDLETQMRRTFYMPSYSLDHFSEVLGLGGKVKMDFSDWVDILNYQSALRFLHNIPTRAIKLSLSQRGAAVEAYCITEYATKWTEIKSKGLLALKKMMYYNRKDVTDSRAIWNDCKKHFKPRFNASAYTGKLVCKRCAGTNIKKNGLDQRSKQTKQRYFCKDCRTEAGMITIRKDGTIDPNGILT